MTRRRHRVRVRDAGGCGMPAENGASECRVRLTAWRMVLIAAPALSACLKVGPDFTPPETPVASAWQEADDPRIATSAPADATWWTAFDDPKLSALIELAQQQNPSVQIAGVRVLQAQAQLGATIGDLYPQKQQVFGELTHERLSDRESSRGLTRDIAERSGVRRNLPSFNDNNSFWVTQFGLGASWELDLWGKFRRAIESADANLIASVASYDDALVSLTAEAASDYVNIRTFEQRLRIARENAETQRETLRLAEVRFRNGQTSETDVEQAKSEYAQTRSQIPQLEIGLRQNQHALSVLLGMPPSNLEDLLGPARGIPVAPPEVAIGIPADLLRRRPDIRSAEQQAAAQSAMIGATKAELFPAFSLSGTFGFLSTDIGNADLSDAFDWKSRVVSFGPAVVWNVLNYGQITNQVRAQDAVFQQAVLSYQNTVLQAQQEVEDALASFLGSQDSVILLMEAVAAARRSVDLAVIEYREGATDYTTVLTAEQNLLEQQDQLAVTQGSVAQGLISLYRALGGGWQNRADKELVPADIREAMAKRTNWGGLLDDASPAREAAPSPIPLPEF
jgi:NodT family efflux transporter outer membrane factor (OMF) lipoprotein